MIVENIDSTTLINILGQISFGLIAGYLFGFLLKRYGATIALIIGVTFVVVEVLSYYGIVTVNWSNLQDGISPVSNFFAQLGDNLGTLLTKNVAFAVAFVPSVIIGFRQTRPPHVKK